MTYTVYLRPDAKSDIEEAAFWYESQESDLGNQFLDEALSVIDKLEETPAIYPKIFQNLRRVLFKKFPFGMYFYLEEQRVIIIAVMHGSRDPTNWQQRT